jgi:hypothetical protein
VCLPSNSRLRKILVESKEDIIPRSSHLDLDVPISVHPAPDILSLRFCLCGSLNSKAHVFLQYCLCYSYGCNHGKTHVLLQGSSYSNYCDFHLHGVNVSLLPLRI